MFSFAGLVESDRIRLMRISPLYVFVVSSFIGGATFADESIEYPRVVRKADGSVCMQSLNSAGTVVEQCRSSNEQWDKAVTRKPKAVSSGEKHALDAPIEARIDAYQYRPQTYLLPKEVGERVKAAQFKAAWSSTLIWVGALTCVGGAIALGASQTPGMESLSATGGISLGVGAVSLLIGSLLASSAGADIDNITEK
jgi:hypothetical protein